MNIQTRRLIHLLVLVVGLLLLVGGIVMHTHGATVIGLIVAAVNMTHLLNSNDQPIVRN